MASPAPDAPKTLETAHPEPAVENAQMLFRDVWNDLEHSVGKSALRFPKEIIWPSSVRFMFMTIGLPCSGPRFSERSGRGRGSRWRTTARYRYQ